MKKATKPKVLVILGPTATGKSSLAVALARKYNGEIISADSRQVYSGLNIGTGKITRREMRGIPHHMLDVISAKKVFTVSDFQKQAREIIVGVLSRGKLPILCGGTGFYIQSIVDGVVLPEVPPNKKLREKLEKKTLSELQTILKKLDSKRYENIERQNPARLVRAIEIATTLGSVPKFTKQKPQYDFLQIGLTLPEPELKKKIHTRLLSRMKAGMVAEATNLHRNGLSWKRMRTLGLEYRYLANYLENKTSKKKLLENIEKGNFDYAKRQMTWFKRDETIQWFSPREERKIERDVAKFIKTV